MWGWSQPPHPFEKEFEDAFEILDDEVIDPERYGDIEIDNDSVNSTDSSSSSKVEPSEQTVCVFRGHSHAVFCGSLSRNGELAVTGGQDDLAYLWNSTTGMITLKCTGHTDSVIYAEFNHDDTYLATGDMEGHIQLWRLSDNVSCWQANIDNLHWMKWHHSANVLLATSDGGTIYMWKLPKGQCKIFSGYSTIVECGFIFPDGKSVAVGCRNGTVGVINLKDGTVVTTISTSQGHTSLVTDIACDMNNKLIISASTDGRTLLSTAHNGKVICVLQDLKSETSAVKDDVPETSSVKDDVARDQQESEMVHHDENWVESVAFCKDPTLSLAATATLEGKLFIWDVSKQVLRHKIEFYSGALIKIQWKDNTSILFVAAVDGETRCVDAKTGSCLQTFKGHRKPVHDLFISQNEKRLLTVSDDFTARVFDISSIP